jgi:hypothetical protein
MQPRDAQSLPQRPLVKFQPKKLLNLLEPFRTLRGSRFWTNSFGGLSALNKLKHRISELELKRRKSRCGACFDKPCPANLDCPIIFFDELLNEVQRRRQNGDHDFAQMVLKAIGKTELV